MTAKSLNNNEIKFTEIPQESFSFKNTFEVLEELGLGKYANSADTGTDATSAHPINKTLKKRKRKNPK